LTAKSTRQPTLKKKQGERQSEGYVYRKEIKEKHTHRWKKLNIYNRSSAEQKRHKRAEARVMN